VERRASRPQSLCHQHSVVILSRIVILSGAKDLLFAADSNEKGAKLAK
jgi:hypothetical protein